MFYEVLDVYLDLTALEGVEERVISSMGGSYEVVFHFANAPTLRETDELTSSRRFGAQPFCRRSVGASAKIAARVGSSPYLGHQS